MLDDKIKIAVFKPYNIKETNSFFSGQHPVFRYLQEKYNYKMTYFIDDKNVKFDTVSIKYIKRDRIKTFILRGLRKIFNKYKYYWKIPYYKDLDFSKYDIIITEGIHYLLLDYFKDTADRVILNDSLSHNYTLHNAQIKYLNKYFNKALVVGVNDKIPILYKKNKLNFNIITIGHSIDTNFIPFLKRKNSRGKLLSIGRFVPEKGFEYIIRAVAVLKRRYPYVKLDIYGRGFLESNLKDLIKSLGLEDAVFIKGFLSYEKLISNLKNYDLFISHPLEKSDFAEPFLMANMEAMANGLPVITSNCGGVPYVVENKAIIGEQKNINQIVEAVENFMNSSAEVEKYSVQGRKYIEENYSVEVIAKKWNEAIRIFLEKI